MASRVRAPVDFALAAYESFARTFSNVFFAVKLFAVWGLLTLIGVIVQQGEDAGFYALNYPAPLARLVLRLGLDNIYHGAAYVAIIALILTSLAVCTFRRVIPARLPPLRPLRAEHVPLNASVTLDGEGSAIRATVEQFFTKRGWQVRKRDFGGEEWTFADRHNWARRGVLVAHVGFVILTAGTFIYWARGFSGQTAVLPGERIAIPKTNVVMQLQGFHYTIKPIVTRSGVVYQPIDYVSRLRIWRAGSVEERTVRVNQPIDVDGTLFYQASYGFATTFSVARENHTLANVAGRPLLESGTFALPGTNRTVQYAGFVPTIDRRTGTASADTRVNDPGVVLNVFDGGALAGSALVPLGKKLDLGGGYSVTPARYELYSGLQYRHDPGIPLVGIGAFVLLAGLCISFYLVPARIHVHVSGSGTRWSVALAATTVKGYEIFADHFQGLVNELRAAQPV